MTISLINLSPFNTTKRKLDREHTAKFETASEIRKFEINPNCPYGKINSKVMELIESLEKAEAKCTVLKGRKFKIEIAGKQKLLSYNQLIKRVQSLVSLYHEQLEMDREQGFSRVEFDKENFQERIYFSKHLAAASIVLQTLNGKADKIYKKKNKIVKVLIFLLHRMFDSIFHYTNKNLTKILDAISDSQTDTYDDLYKEYKSSKSLKKDKTIRELAKEKYGSAFSQKGMSVFFAKRSNQYVFNIKRIKELKETLNTEDVLVPIADAFIDAHENKNIRKVFLSANQAIEADTFLMKDLEKANRKLRVKIHPDKIKGSPDREELGKLLWEMADITHTYLKTQALDSSEEV